MTATVLPTSNMRTSSGRTQLERAGRTAWAVLGLIIVGLAALAALRTLSIVVVPLLVATLPAAALAPAVTRLRRIGAPPWLAATVAIVVVVGVVGGVVAVAVPAVSSQMGAVGTAFADSASRLDAWLATRPLGVPATRVADLVARARTLVTGGAGVLARIGTAADVAVRGVTEALVGVIALFFYLKDGQVIARWAREALPERWQHDAAEMARLSWSALSEYIRGQLVIAAADGATVGLGLALLRVPLAPVLGALVALCALIPVVGAITGGAIAVVVAFAAGGLPLALAVLALVVGVFQLEAHVLSPLVLGRAVRLHPLAVLVALGCGGTLAGVLGALLAVPLLACATRAVSYLRAREDAAPSAHAAEAPTLRPA